ncbi:hypothetical protein [Johnsonella ignava]|nr:hypothetical protein [Johnsonella ignava]
MKTATGAVLAVPVKLDLYVEVWSEMFRINKINLIVVSLIIISSSMLSGCFSELKAEKNAKREAMAMFNAKDYANAAVKFDEAFNIRKGSKIDASRADILEYKAEALYLSGNYSASGGVYALLSEAYPNNTDYMDMRVICICRADEDIVLAKNIYDASEAKLNAAGQKNAGKGDLTSSNTVVTATFGTSSGVYNIHVEALCELTTSLSRTDEGATQALAYYSTMALDDARLNAKFCNQIGRLYYMKNDYANAVNFYEKGLSIGGDDKTIKALKFNLAVAYEAGMHFEKALELFEDYVKTYGGEEIALHEISFIKSRIKGKKEN